jgi:hypothetical protein
MTVAASSHRWKVVRFWIPISDIQPRPESLHQSVTLCDFFVMVNGPAADATDAPQP